MLSTICIQNKNIVGIKDRNTQDKIFKVLKEFIGLRGDGLADWH